MDITGFVHRNREQAFALGDYASYRKQLSRQVAALRRKLKIATPKNQKFSKRTALSAEQVVKDKLYVRLQVLAAERAWAHAMAIKSAHTQDSAGEAITGSTRKFIISRLHKAAGFAKQLVTVLAQKQAVGATEHDYLNAAAYSRCLQGNVEFEKQFSKRYDDVQVQKTAWNKCLVLFSEAHVIYSALLHTAKKRADTYKEVIAGTVDPSIRYAAYQSRIPRTVPVATVAKQNFRQDQKELLAQITTLHPNALSEDQTVVSESQDGLTATGIPTAVTWRGRTAPIADASIGQSLAATSVAAADLGSRLKSFSSSQKFAAAYEPVLNAAQDTVDAVRRAIADLTKEGVAEADSRMQDLRVTDLAANYALISWRIGRNRVLSSSSATSLDDGLAAVSSAGKKRGSRGKNGQPPKPLSRPQRLAALRDRSVLLLSTIQSLDAIAALPGASRDAAFVAELDAQRAYFRALRLLNIGYAHAALGADKERETLALWAQAAKLATSDAATAASSSSAISTVPLVDPSGDETGGVPTLAIYLSQVSRLQALTGLLVDRQRGLVSLRQHMSARVSSEDGTRPPPLMHQGLDSYPAAPVDLTNLVALPPRLQPVPVKPIFLDLAWNYIQYPGQAGGAGSSTAATATRAVASVLGVTGAGSGGGSGGDEDVAMGDASGNSAQDTTPKKKGWFGFGR